jgi:hypothetical protein
METRAEQLRRQARLCRAARNGTTDELTREALRTMALEYDRRAAEAEAFAASQPPPPPPPSES